MVKHLVEQVLARTLDRCVAEGLLPPGPFEIGLEAPKQAAHGDFSSNIAMTLSRRALGALEGKPRDLAKAIADRVVDPDGIVAKVEIAGPGFLNVRLSADVWPRALGEVLAQGAAFGTSNVGAGRRVMVEFVSANPTGPMHVGHGRGAVVGDVCASLLTAAGYQVVREYYVNDAGRQVAALAHSVYQRLREHCGVGAAELGPDDYPGAYVADVARAMATEWGDARARSIAAQPFSENAGLLQTTAVNLVLDTMIKPTLSHFGIRFDHWFFESKLHREHEVERAIAELDRRGFIAVEVLPPPKGMEPSVEESATPGVPLKIFKSTHFGDDADRPLANAAGVYTYFAGDVAYHWDKLQRGFDRLVNVWGADHGGYVKRVQFAVEALSGKKGQPEVVLTQMVNLLKDGVPLRMGKRSGNFVELQEVIDEVGADAARIWFIQRRHDAAVDFDLAKAKEQSNDNPVFYVQYGHARLASILRKAAEQGVAAPRFDLETARALTLPEETDLLKRILAYPELVAGAATALEPHRVVFFLTETIGAFHSYYTKYKHTERVIGPDAKKTAARLLLCLALKQVLANALALCGVSAPEAMARAEMEQA